MNGNPVTIMTGKTTTGKIVREDRTNLSTVPIMETTPVEITDDRTTGETTIANGEITIGRIRVITTGHGLTTIIRLRPEITIQREIMTARVDTADIITRVEVITTGQETDIIPVPSGIMKTRKMNPGREMKALKNGDFV
jgi:hypothetical protein